MKEPHIIVQFVGFQSKNRVREYTFTVREPATEPREYTISIPNEAFDSRADKKKADQRELTRPFRLEASDVGCLQTLGAAGNFEFNRLAFVQRLVTFRLNGRKVDENVLAGLALDEPKTLAGIKPLHCSLFSH